MVAPEQRCAHFDGPRTFLDDAGKLGLSDGGQARVTTRRGSALVAVEVNDRMQSGHVSLPNGLGLDYPDVDGNMVTTGTSPNELTWSSLADEYVGTPWHKSVPAKIEAIET